MAENLREIVLDILLEQEREGTYLNKLINSVLDKYDYLDSRDKAFIKTLAEGTVERRITLDYYINSVSKVKTEKQKPLIRNLLRMGAYQIFYMDKVPASAVCNEAVKLAKKRQFVNLSGFVNGVLRTLSKQSESLLPGHEDLSVFYSCPEWMVKHFMDNYGAEATEEILEGLSVKHKVTLYPVNREAKEKITAELEKNGAAFEDNKYNPSLISVRGTDNISALETFENGLFYVQDVSSAEAVDRLEITEGSTVIDVCAAPGGKSLAAALKAGARGKVFSFDIGENKIERITENAERLKLLSLTAQNMDATAGDETLFGTADFVIADVPCSGLGVIGKKCDIKYRISREDLHSLSVLQRQIVDVSVKYLKDGGTMLYSTCTINPEENERNAEYIMEKYGFEKIVERQIFPDEYRDGFYYCVLKKK